MDDKYRVVLSHVIASAGAATLGFLAGRMMQPRAPALPPIDDQRAGPRPHIFAAGAKPNFYYWKNSSGDQMVFLDTPMVAYLLDHTPGARVSLGDGNIGIEIIDPARNVIASVFLVLVKDARAPGQVGDLYAVRGAEGRETLRKLIQPWIDENAVTATEVVVAGF